MLKFLLGSADQKCRRAGRDGERQVADLLARELPDTYLVINNYPLQVNGRTKDIDHIVIGPSSGVFIIETKAWTGTILRNERGYVRIKGSREEQRGNPEAQVNHNMNCLKGVLAAHGLKDWINTVVVFPSATAVKGKGQIPVLRPDTLVETILGNKPHHRPDAGSYRTFFLKELAAAKTRHHQEPSALFCGPHLKSEHSSAVS